ncbi:hypothetical protein CALCODRAFT_21656 [Calocera cornea HHB12733]|uniref:Uncharacterized protein n=1 Tax=Calocera cornea HHB12733 TaxID=1353952 RepID=A0A165E6A9_9BASI|nr:hypothetical protein CALCODRAFT_21656 [Calocera cornea HHB12733]
MTCLDRPQPTLRAHSPTHVRDEVGRQKAGSGGLGKGVGGAILLAAGKEERQAGGWSNVGPVGPAGPAGWESSNGCAGSGSYARRNGCRGYVCVRKADSGAIGAVPSCLQRAIVPQTDCPRHKGPPRAPCANLCQAGIYIFANRWGMADGNSRD